MWALLDKKTKIVIGALPPNTLLEEIEKIKETYNLIAMTLENSPATIGDKYIDGKFYPPKELING
jgi:hypothetical protein